MKIALLNLATLVAGASAVNVCGTIGTHDSSKLNTYMGNFFYRGPSTFLLCGLYCRKDPTRCKAFRYSFFSDAAAQYCEFFDSGLDGNVTADSSQPYYYYDIGCALPSYGDIQTTTVSTTTTTTGSSVSTTTVTSVRTTTATTTSVIISQVPTTSTISLSFTVTISARQSFRIEDFETTTTTTTSVRPVATRTVTQNNFVDRTRTITSCQATRTATQTIRPTNVISTRTRTVTVTSTRPNSTRRPQQFEVEDVNAGGAQGAGSDDPFRGWWVRQGGA